MLDYLRNIKQLLIALLRKSNTTNRFTINTYKNRSNTLFILATGTTIKDISEKQWSYIKQHDSFAINFFLYHDFIPDVYMVEHIANSKMRKEFIRLVPKYLKHKYPIIITNDHSWSLIQNNKKFNILKDFFNTKLLEKLKIFKIQFGRHKHLNSLWFSRFLNIFISKKYFLHIRGSVSVAIDFAIKKEFKNIVFCGVDMDNKGHFYDHKQHDAKLHRTAQRLWGNITLGDYINYCNKKYKKINFYVSSKESLLSKSIPVFEWE